MKSAFPASPKITHENVRNWSNRNQIDDSTDSNICGLHDDIAVNDDDGWCTFTGAEDDRTFNADILLSAPQWPDYIAPKYDTFKEEVLSFMLFLERTWNRIESVCSYVKEAHLKQSGLELEHLIALSLFIGNYNFDSIYYELIDCLSSPTDGQMQKLYHMKRALQEAFWKLDDIRSIHGCIIPLGHYHGFTLQEALPNFLFDINVITSKLSVEVESWYK